MPVRVTIAGTTFETDSVADAIEIHRALHQGSSVSTAANGKQAIAFGSADAPQKQTESRFTPAKIMTFVNTLNENGKKVVAALLAHPAGLTTDELAREISLASASLPPVMRHVRTMAERAALDPDRALRRVQISADGKPKSRYRLAEEVITEMRKEG